MYCRSDNREIFPALFFRYLRNTRNIIKRNFLLVNSLQISEGFQIPISEQKNGPINYDHKMANFSKDFSCKFRKNGQFSAILQLNKFLFRTNTVRFEKSSIPPRRYLFPCVPDMSSAVESLISQIIRFRAIVRDLTSNVLDLFLILLREKNSS